MQSVWERERKEKGNALTVLLATWIKVHKQGEERPQPSRVAKHDNARDTSSSISSEEYSNVEENSAAAMEERADSDGEDIVQDLILSSDESD